MEIINLIKAQVCWGKKDENQRQGLLHVLALWLEAMKILRPCFRNLANVRSRVICKIDGGLSWNPQFLRFHTLIHLGRQPAEAEIGHGLEFHLELLV